jgi:hypothetical protein
MEKFFGYLKSSPDATSQFINGVMKQNYLNEQYWEEVCPLLNFEDPKVETWVLNNIDLFNLKYLVRYGHCLTLNVIDYILLNLDLIEPDDLIKYQSLSNTQLLKFVESNPNIINWVLIQEFQHMDQEFVNKYETNLDWDLISEYQFMDLKFLLTNKSKISWHLIPTNIHFQQIINQSFLKLFADTNIWDGIGWLDNDIITIDVLLNEFPSYLTLKSIKSIERANEDELVKEIRDKLSQIAHNLRIISKD